MKNWFFIWVLLLSVGMTAQDVLQDTLVGYVVDGDTIYTRELPIVTVTPEPRTEFKNRRERRYYGRLLRDVKMTLPYAKLAADLLEEVADSLHIIESKKVQNQYIKTIEKELLAEYEPVLRKMSMRQGRVLIKLIDRECQVTSYEVVKIYRGSFSAFFWQGIARIFGSDLKSDYDPLGEDALMEEVVLLVEAGAI